LSEYPSWLEVVSEAFETKFGNWQQPNELDPCRAGLGGCPVQWTTGYELRKLTVSWLRAVGVTPVQDAGMCTFHFLNLTGGDPDATWTTSDYTTVENGFNTLWSYLAGFYTAQTKLGDYTWRPDGPAFKPFGSSLSPTLRTAVSSQIAGSGGGEALPPQSAITVTEVTPAKYTVTDVEGVGTQSRNRWGRFYLPAVATTHVTSGRVKDTTAEVIATKCQDFYNACVTADLVPVMYSPTTGSAWAVNELHVDDIYDVIRSRRFVTPLSRHIKAITAP
jgi:hypothetical protein